MDTLLTIRQTYGLIANKLRGAERKESMSFAQQLTVTIVDKLVIGALILLAGFVLNRALEQYKAKDAFTKEIARKRVDEMGEIWSTLYQYDFLINDLEDVTSRVKLMQSGYLDEDQFGYSQKELEKKGKRLAEESTKRKEEIPRQLEKARYWVGEEAYKQYFRYFETQRQQLEQFFRFLAAADDKESAEIWKKHEQAKNEAKKAQRDVLRVVDELTW